MDSDNYFWSANGDENGMMQNNIAIEGYVQQSGQPQEQGSHDSESSKSSPLIAATSSPSSVLHTKTYDMSDGKVGVDTTDAGLSIGIVNPDAIEPKARSYTCRICQMSFPNKSAVTVHSRLHTDNEGKPYRCGFCGKGFSTNFYLKQHERIHSGQKPYKCPMCDNTFKQLSHVQQHVRTHTGVRPYKCHWPGCGKAFLQQSHLKSHEARHVPKEANGIRPFKCHWPDCGKSFAQLTNLKSHVARHTPGKGKSKKGGNTSKKPDNDDHPSESDSPFGLMSPQNVINQAAAAANIVPGMCPDDEAQIQPFLCPGCSKLYVREATFKKHLEECKTKLQLSISATATALGIEPPPPLAEANLEFDSAPITITSVSSAPPSKRIHLEVKQMEVKHEESPIIEQYRSLGFQLTDRATGTSGSTVASNLQNPVSVKRELEKKQNPTETTSFLPKRPSSEDRDFKFPQIVETTSLYNVQVTEPEMSLSNDLSLKTDSKKPHLVMSNEQINPSSPQIHSQNLILTTVGSQPDATIPLMVTHTNTSSQLDNPTSNDSKDIATTSGHSTINEAAIRWQWDQSVPRLNYP